MKLLDQSLCLKVCQRRGSVHMCGGNLGMCIHLDGT